MDEHLACRSRALRLQGLNGDHVYWLFTDETNVTDKEGDFFIYGGIIVSAEQMKSLDAAVREIRQRYGFKRGDQFKFQTKSRPEQVSIEDFTKAKAEALDLLEAHGARVVMYVVLHQIARQKSVQEMTAWALNSLLSHFDFRFLAEHDDVGAVCIDRLDPKFGYSYIKGAFGESLTLPGGREIELDRIVLYTMSCDGASHLSSLADIALGSMRYAVNFCTGSGKETVARQIMTPLARAMWFHEEADVRRIGGYGFLQYPKDIRVASYQAQYTSLVAKLTGLIEQGTT